MASFTVVCVCVGGEKVLLLSLLLLRFAILLQLAGLVTILYSLFRQRNGQCWDDGVLGLLVDTRFDEKLSGRAGRRSIMVQIDGKDMHACWFENELASLAVGNLWTGLWSDRCTIIQFRREKIFLDLGISKNKTGFCLAHHIHEHSMT